MTSIRAKVSEAGRLSIPAEFRRAVGLEQGGDVVVSLQNGEIRIRTLDEAIAQAQAATRQLLGGKRGASVDRFLAERRRMARRE
jgi:AbrB family looped-hinge helix DNA binding protein